MEILNKYLHRRIFELAVKIILYYQKEAMITGRIIYTFYKGKPHHLRCWKGFTTEMMPMMDAYVVRKKHQWEK